MLWAIVILGVIVAAFAVPKFGKAVLAFLGVIVVLVAIGGLYLFASNRRDKAEREAAKARIRPNEIELVDLAFRNGYSGSYTLIGRIRNRSTRYTLSEISLRFTMKDCMNSNECETVGQTVDTMYVSVPPGQARDLNEFVSFSGLGTARGEHQWNYEVVEILGK